jgi:hypothetical protein
MLLFSIGLLLTLAATLVLAFVQLRKVLHLDAGTIKQARPPKTSLHSAP